MSTIPYTLKFNRMGEWARQQSLFKLRGTYVAYGVRGLICQDIICYIRIKSSSKQCTKYIYMFACWFNFWQI